MVTGLEKCLINSLIRLTAGVRLQVGVFRAKNPTSKVSCKAFEFVVNQRSSELATSRQSFLNHAPPIHSRRSGRRGVIARDQVNDTDLVFALPRAKRKQLLFRGFKIHWRARRHTKYNPLSFYQLALGSSVGSLELIKRSAGVAEDVIAVLNANGIPNQIILHSDGLPFRRSQLEIAHQRGLLH